MVRLGACLLVSFALTLAMFWLAPRDVAASRPCARASYKTSMVAAACRKGGQNEAKAVMKQFVKEAKKRKPGLSCASCHTKVGGDYPLKANALEMFRDHGGK